ncbi:MAG: ABC transporter permease [Pseudomonadota bacterium]|uniref:ABC transporter permease n=1 Tax=Thalassovita sp. TaxID=1979401 RepID=UPI002AB1558A|nr:ABC transporter permease [Thalassovita sp.]MEC7964892.1 ABC transporter permease [Pseudomonadota bacterium]MEC8040044.1 ABC transporter permease [Pseudomonadota bacterium]MEC8293723.1 ABC transporter permease [Pseudomonadota bacterium]
MFYKSRKETGLEAAVMMAELTYHSIARKIRNTHGNAVLSILVNLLQLMIMVIAFYAMFTLLGLRSVAVRGDFMLYLMSGIFLYMTHAKTLGAVVGSEGPTSAMMLHAPMNTIIAIMSSALSALYLQVLALSLILFIYYMGFNKFVIEDAAGAFGMLLLAWFGGLAIGTVLLALKPWFPAAVQIITLIYQRANMIASGKMFLANSLPGFMLAMFDWNPLFHAIDQARGFVFINYVPRYSSIKYALICYGVILMLGLIGEFYTRRHSSLSWGARR